MKILTEEDYLNFNHLIKYHTNDYNVIGIFCGNDKELKKIIKTFKNKIIKNWNKNNFYKKENYYKINNTIILFININKQNILGLQMNFSYIIENSIIDNNKREEINIRTFEIDHKQIFLNTIEDMDDIMKKVFNYETINYSKYLYNNKY